MRVRRVVIWSRPDEWDILDFKIGNRSQYLRSGVIPGSAFSPSFHFPLHTETCQTAMDVTLQVRYIGNSQDGIPFRATLACEVIDPI